MSLASIVLASIAALLAGYIVYGRLLSRLFRIDPRAPTPAVTQRDDVDFVPISPRFLFGQQLSAIAAAGPIVGLLLGGHAASYPAFTGPAGKALAGKPNIIYAQGLTAFLERIRVPVAFGVSFALLAFTTFVYDTLDVCTRLGRYIVVELTGWRGRPGRCSRRRSPSACRSCS